MITQKDYSTAVDSLSGALGQGLGAQKADYLERLKSYLQNQSQAQALERNISTIKQMRDSGLIDKESPVSVEASGSVSIPRNPLMQYLMRGQMDTKHGVDKNMKTAISQYEKGASPLDNQLAAVQEGLELTSDPKNIGSLGQARTLTLKALGMNRFNEDEAKQVLPATALSSVKSLMIGGGADTSPLQGNQINSVQTLFKTLGQTLKQRHEQLKQQSIASLKASPYYDPSQDERVQSQFQARDQRFNQVLSPSPGANAMTGQPFGNLPPGLSEQDFYKQMGL